MVFKILKFVIDFKLKISNSYNANLLSIYVVLLMAEVNKMLLSSCSTQYKM